MKNLKVLNLFIMLSGLAMPNFAQNLSQVNMNEEIPRDTVYFPKYDTIVKMDTVTVVKKVIEKDTITLIKNVEVERKGGDEGRGSIADWRNSHGIGIGFGLLSGSGLQYRRWYEKNGFQFTAIPVFSLSEQREEFLLSAGFVGLRNLWASDEYKAGIFGPMTSNFHFYYGVSAFVDYYREKEMNTSKWGESRGERALAGGTGIGIEFNTAHLRYSIGVGYAIQYNEEWRLKISGNEKILAGVPDMFVNLQWYFK